VRLDLDRHLVGRATDAAALDLEGGADVVERLLERRDGILAVLRLDALEGVVDDGSASDFLPSTRILFTSWVTIGAP
jgi:hypothetical protein